MVKVKSLNNLAKFAPSFASHPGGVLSMERCPEDVGSYYIPRSSGSVKPDARAIAAIVSLLSASVGNQPRSESPRHSRQRISRLS